MILSSESLSCAKLACAAGPAVKTQNREDRITEQSVTSVSALDAITPLHLYK